MPRRKSIQLWKVQERDTDPCRWREVTQVLLPLGQKGRLRCGEVSLSCLGYKAKDQKEGLGFHAREQEFGNGLGFERDLEELMIKVERDFEESRMKVERDFEESQRVEGKRGLLKG